MSDIDPTRFPITYNVTRAFELASGRDVSVALSATWESVSKAVYALESRVIDLEAKIGE